MRIWNGFCRNVPPGDSSPDPTQVSWVVWWSPLSLLASEHQVDVILLRAGWESGIGINSAISGGLA